MNVLSIQPTPNPNAFKFVVDQVLAEGTLNYSDKSVAKGHELAEKLFEISGVETLFFCDRFVTVSMLADADWRKVHEESTRVLEATDLRSPAGAADAETPVVSRDELSAADQKLLDEIDVLLDDRVRPALAGDGGGLEVIGLSGKTLQIRYQGACGSCPSAISGTLHAIQDLIQSEIDEDMTVVPA